MAIPVEGRDISVGDWSPARGTVTAIQEHKNFRGEVEVYTLHFFNGESVSLRPDEQIEIIQNGSDIVHNGMPDLDQVRYGLKSDHENR